jgi:hypothetical protein
VQLPITFHLSRTTGTLTFRTAAMMVLGVAACAGRASDATRADVCDAQSIAVGSWVPRVGRTSGLSLRLPGPVTVGTEVSSSPGGVVDTWQGSGITFRVRHGVSSGAQEDSQFAGPMPGENACTLVVDGRNTVVFTAYRDGGITPGSFLRARVPTAGDSAVVVSGYAPTRGGRDTLLAILRAAENAR